MFVGGHHAFCVLCCMKIDRDSSSSSSCKILVINATVYTYSNIQARNVKREVISTISFSYYYYYNKIRIKKKCGYVVKERVPVVACRDLTSYKINDLFEIYGIN